MTMMIISPFVILELRYGGSSSLFTRKLLTKRAYIIIIIISIIIYLSVTDNKTNAVFLLTPHLTRGYLVKAHQIHMAGYFKS
jgi:hypothetical protein